MTRQNKIILIVGRRGCGKTTLAQQLIKRSRLKVCVFDLYDHPDYRYLPLADISKLSRWKSGNLRVISSDPVPDLTELFKTVNNCTVFLEDSKRYIDPNVQKQLQTVIIQHRMFNQDIIMMFHSLKDVPNYIARMHNDMILFKTNETIAAAVKDKFSNWGDIAEAHARINKHKSPYYNEAVNMQ